VNHYGDDLAYFILFTGGDLGELAMMNFLRTIRWSSIRMNVSE